MIESKKLMEAKKIKIFKMKNKDRNKREFKIKKMKIFIIMRRKKKKINRI